MSASSHFIPVQHAVRVTDQVAQFVRCVETDALGRLHRVEKHEGRSFMPAAKGIHIPGLLRQGENADSLGFQEVNHVANGGVAQPPLHTKCQGGIFR